MAYASPLQTVVDLLYPASGGLPFSKSFQLFNQNAVTGPTAFTIPTSGTLQVNGLPVAITRGWLRARFSAATGTTPVVSALTVTATDSSGNTVALNVNFFTSPTLSATTEVEYLAPFFSERALNKFTFTVTMTGTAPTAQADFEVVGQHV